MTHTFNRLTTVAALDIGSSKVCCIIAKISRDKKIKVIGYGYNEQIRDIVPAFLASFASAALAFLFSKGIAGAPAIIAVQIAVMCGSYLVIARIFKIEALTYLIDTLKRLIRR